MNELQPIPDSTSAFDGEDEYVDMDGDTMTLAGEYVELQLRLRDTKSESDMLDRRAKALEPVLLERMNIEGCQNINVRGMTLYRKTDRYVSKAKGVETEEVVAALFDIGMGWLVNDSYNAMKLKSAIMEKIDAGEELPEQIKPLLNIGEVHRLGARK